ncbi:unnamed protein product [Oikopleura dioica]|uniref:Uncharacterized protein n=1 Tax=Oikopleura dioica TaxID=34765 RepID=E4YQI2_OIKDI|nr:unnamed protein product [Oikopleura dioica]
MAWLFIPSEFVISSDGQCGKCKGVTKFYMKNDSDEEVFRITCDYATSFGFYDKLCFNCSLKVVSSLKTFTKSQCQFSGGSFKCPANCCIGEMSFETFIKRECCIAAQSLRAKETLEKIDNDLEIQVEKMKDNISAHESLAHHIATVGNKVEIFVEKFANFFPDNGRIESKCYNKIIKR